MPNSQNQNFLVFLAIAFLLTISCYSRKQRAGAANELDTGLEVEDTDASDRVNKDDCCIDLPRRDAKLGDVDIEGKANDDAIHNEPDAGLDSGLDAVVDTESNADLDAGKDALTPNCDPNRCPDPRIPGENTFYGVLPCCTLDGECGVFGTYILEDCEPLVEGWLDATCLDAEVEGEGIEGCCRPDGRCGHMHEELGCHELFNERWSFELKRCGQLPTDPSPPNPFECIGNEDAPCSYDWECCKHNNYSTSCSDPYDLGYSYCNTCPEC
jgi:hypothetical protein